MQERNGWICCQLGSREHYALPRAFHRKGVLDLLFTDAWVGPRNPLGLLNSGLRSRFHAELGGLPVYSRNFGNIGFEVKARWQGLRGWPLMMGRNEWFQKAAVEDLSRARPNSKSRTVVTYSYAARDVLRFAKSQGWRTVLAQIDPGPVEERIVASLYAHARDQAGRWQAAPDRYWADWKEECKLADRIVVNSPWSQAALLEEGVPAHKLRIVPLAYEPATAVEYERTYPEAFSSSRPLRVLFLGQINLRKGIGPLLEAADMLRGEPIEFTMVGPIQVGTPPELQENPGIRWVGPVPHAGAHQFYRDADLFIFPTFSDGFGLTQLEAQAWKLPIITTARCGEVVNDGINGYILHDVTASELAFRLRHCLKNPSELKALSRQCQVSEQFSLTRVAEQWVKVFD